MKSFIVDYQLNFFGRGKTSDDLLKSEDIIRAIIAPVSYWDNNTQKSISLFIYGKDLSLTSLFLMMGKKFIKRIIVQFGKYEYFKDKKDILNCNIQLVFHIKRNEGFFLGNLT